MKNKQCEVRDVVQWAASLLANRGIEGSRLEGELLVAKCLDIDRATLLARLQEPFPDQAWEQCEALVKRRGEHYPLQYLTGTQDFMGLGFSVKEGVLIPRGDTEVLVETVLALDYTPENILDVGTGSGIIAVSLAVNLTECRVTALDVSCRALELALTNAKKFEVEDRISFLQADIFHWFPDKEDSDYDLIVSNPPYVTAQEMQMLQQEVSFEPQLALYGGEEGLDFYFRLAGLAGDCLTDPGSIVVEIGWQQAETVTEIFAASGFRDISVMQDYGGRDRVIVCRKRQV